MAINHRVSTSVTGSLLHTPIVINHIELNPLNTPALDNGQLIISNNGKCDRCHRVASCSKGRG